MDGVKVALGNRGMTVEAARQCAKDRKEWMPLHDAVGIHCKQGATTENQDSGVRYMGSGVYLDDCVCDLPALT